MYVILLLNQPFEIRVVLDSLNLASGQGLAPLA